MTTMKMKTITPSAMAALTPAETEVAEDGPIEDAAGEPETLAVLLADPGLRKFMLGVGTLVVRDERDTGAVAASICISLVPGAFEVRSDVVEIWAENDRVSNLPDLDPARRVPEDFCADLEGFTTETIEVFNTMLVVGFSTDEALSTAATAGNEDAATFGMETVGIVGAATIGVADAAALVSVGMGVPSVVCPA